MGPAGERNAKCYSRRQSASPAQKSPSTASPERTANTSSQKQNPPDIVISASPRFTRKKDFKAAGRIRSKDKNIQKKPVSMENKDLPQEAITQSAANEDIEPSEGGASNMVESFETFSCSPTEFTVTEVIRETLDEDGICVSSTTHIETMSSDGQTISTVTQESNVSNLNNQTIIGSDEGQSTQLEELHTKEERKEVMEPEFVLHEAYTVGSQEEIARVTSTHQTQECLVVETSDSQSQFEEFQQVETKQNYAELKGEGATSSDETSLEMQDSTVQDDLTSLEMQETTLQDNLTRLEMQETTVQDNLTSLEMQETTLQDNLTSLEKQNSTMQDNLTRLEMQESTVQDNLTRLEMQETTVQDNLTNIEYTTREENAVFTSEMENHVNQVSTFSSVESSSVINGQEVENKYDYTCSENVDSASRKPSSLALDKNGDGSSFWTHSARNSVISSPSRDGLTDNLGSPTESVRDILLQKRVSLTHTPDIVRVFDKDFQQTSRDMHEFQKVKNELKHVEEQAATMRKMSQVSESSRTQDIVSESFESTTSCLAQEEEAEALRALDSVVTEAAKKVRSRAMSKDMIVDLIPGPVVNMQRKSVKEEDKMVSKQVSKSNTSALQTKKKASEERKSEKKMVEQKNARNTEISEASGTAVKKNAVRKEKSKTTMITAQSAKMTAEKSQQSKMSLEQTKKSESSTTESDNTAAVSKKSSARNTKSIARESSDIKRSKSNEKRNVSKSGPNDKKGLLQSPNLIKQVKASISDKNTDKKQVASTNGSLESPGLLRDINGGSNKSITGRTGSPSRKTPTADSKSSSPIPAIVRSLSPEGKPPTVGTRRPSMSDRTLSPDRKSLHRRSPSVISGRSISPAGKSPSRKDSALEGIEQDDAELKSASKSSLNSGKSGNIGRSPSVISGRSISPAGKSPSRKDSSLEGIEQDEAKIKSTSKSSLNSGKSGNIGNMKRQNSKVREKTMKKEDMLFEKNKNGENKENGFAIKKEPPKTTVSTAKGGFLAPTKAWLSHMGDPVNLKSRSPSPAPVERKRSTTVPRKITDRSPSPRRRMRDSSSESESKEKSRKPAVVPPPRKMMEKDPNLPSVKRSTSMRSKQQTNGGLKRTDSMKKTITNGIDKDLAGTKAPQENGVAKSESNTSEKQKASSIKIKQRDLSASSATRKQRDLSASSATRKQRDLSASRVTRKGASNKSETKSQININSAETAAKTKPTSGPKKVPPPVAPKPICASNINSEFQVSDSNLVNRSDDSTLSSTAVVTQNQSSVEVIANNNTTQVVSSVESTNAVSVSQVEHQSDANTTIMQTADLVVNASKAVSSDVSAESGIEETSISATQVIQKFETQSQAIAASTESSFSSNLMQETVSSRMKKVSAEEFAMERKSSSLKTEEVACEENEESVQESSKEVTEVTTENISSQNAKSVARSKSFSAKKSSTAVSNVAAKKSSVTVSSSAVAANLSTTVSNGVSSSVTAKNSSTSVSTSNSISAVKKSSVSSSSNTVNTKKASISATSLDSSKTSEISKKSSTSIMNAKSSAVASSTATSSSTAEESSSQSFKVNSSTEQKISSVNLNASAKSSSQSSSTVVTSSGRSSSLQRSESKGVKQVTAKKNSRSQETNGSSGADTKFKTTMVVRLHPGQSRRLSAYMDQQDQKGEDMSTRTWLGDVQYQDNPASICGLEISFSSVPQDIDIKLIPGNSNCAIDNQESGEAAKAEARPTQSGSSETLDVEPDQNKTRQ